MISHSQTLINALKKPTLYTHPVSKLEIIETHISWVILTGPYAYKIKKPLALGFLDFSTLSSRKHYCELELTLNQRLAPDYYLDVVPITGSYINPQFYGVGEVIEYALKMVQFPQKNELDRALDAGSLNQHAMNLIAEKIADFHKNISIANSHQSYGDLTHIHQPVLNCYSEIFKQIDSHEDRHKVKQLQDWSCNEFKRLKTVFISRKKDGFIRECHGDLHLRNIAIVGEDVIAFDCIEFNEELRWNDLMSEIAFLVMDLDNHQQTGLASAFLNRYLEITGDYLGLKVFRYYLVYRAMVRAMVCSIRLSQKDLTDEKRAEEYGEYSKYIALAETYTKPHQAKLFITHGLSGSGKTTLTNVFLQAFPVIRIRSDIERKRLNKIGETERKKQGIAEGAYNQSSTEKTYQILYQLAEQMLDAEFSVIVDATFLKINQRKKFAKLANLKHLDFTIVHCHASLDVMENRVIQRNKKNLDASDADYTVLQSQISQDEAFVEEEKKYVVSISTEENINESLRCKLGWA